MSPPRTATLATQRLLLRPSDAADSARAFEVQSNWNVTRMLRMASWPPDREAMDAWFAEHADEWTSGRAYRFAVTLEGRMIGLADIDEISGATGDLGYWFDEPYWGRGYASEAAAALVRFAFDELRFTELVAGHAEDNVASSRVLRRVGFQHVRDMTVHSRSRGGPILLRKYVLRGGPGSPPGAGPDPVSAGG